MSERAEVTICLTGPPASGKTAILARLVSGEFPEHYTKTTGASMRLTEMKLDEKTVTVHIFDLGGADELKEMRLAVYPTTHCAVVVFDLSNEESLRLAIEYVREYLSAFVEKKRPIVLAGNKSDIKSVPDSKVRELVSAVRTEVGAEVPYVEVSAKTGENLTELLRVAVQLALAEITR